ncbi:MAG: rhomboid family intramembrane serine protease [Spirochaetia bacterium]|nr:rhomboid family intramembrane serine protease [Spirochaetales bacterium]
MNKLPFHKRPLAYRYYNATLTLIIINVGLFLVTFLFPRTTIYLALTPYLVVRERAIWQVVTYMFIHGGTWHILFNMLALFIFGTPLERKLGSSEFLLYYFITGVGAGLATLVINWYTGLAIIPVVGASGAIYGLLLAYATLYPDARLFIFGILPLRAPIAVLLFAGLALFSQLTGTRNGVAHLTHLAGFVFGYLYFLIRMGINPIKVFFRRY